MNSGDVTRPDATVSDPDGSLLGRTPGLPDAVYASDGLVTKRVIRAAALAHLRPAPGELLWDVGAGAGSIGIEWCRTDPGCRAVGLERNAERAERARANAARLTLPGQLEIRDGAAADLVGDLPAPDAVFFGGGATRALVERAWAALRPGGRLVVHGVTLETDELAIGLLRDLGGEYTRILTEAAAPLGSLMGLAPARAVVQWAGTQGGDDL